VSLDIFGTHDTEIDPARWPAAASALVADRLLRRVAARLPVQMSYPDGTATGAAHPTLPTLVVTNPSALVRRVDCNGFSRYPLSAAHIRSTTAPVKPGATAPRTMTCPTSCSRTSSATP
jgi:hypothetical protein